MPRPSPNAVRGKNQQKIQPKLWEHFLINIFRQSNRKPFLKHYTTINKAEHFYNFRELNHKVNVLIPVQSFLAHGKEARHRRRSKHPPRDRWLQGDEVCGE